MLHPSRLRPDVNSESRASGRKASAVPSAPTRRLAGPLCAWLVLAGGAMPAAAADLGYRCVNQASGANWRVSVDVEHGRVDNLPARVDANSIRWQDAERRSFELDRATLMLKMRNASSTGGYYLDYTCRPE
jgi:hypothetical protein